MKTLATCLVALGLLVMVGSMVRTPGEHDMFTGIGVIRYSPRLCMTTSEGRYGITEFSKEAASGVRNFETYFQWGLHFIKLQFCAPVAASFVSAPLAFFGILLLFPRSGGSDKFRIERRFA
jgi:hypothetical protein